MNTETITLQNAVPNHLPSAFILLERQGSVISEAHGLTNQNDHPNPASAACGTLKSFPSFLGSWPPRS